MMKRRLFLKAALAALEYNLLVGAGLLVSRQVIGQWQADVFHATTLDAAMDLITGGQSVSSFDAITLVVPSIVEDGCSVQVTVRSRLSRTDWICLFAKNPNPAVAAFRLEPGLEPAIDTRIG